MKILGFVGSPRADGTTRLIVEQFLAGAEAAGAATGIYQLNDLNFKGCQGCRKCKTEGACTIQDDMTPIYAEILAADLIVLGSPVYMAYVTGQTKLFLDRLYAFSGSDQVSRIPAGKKCLLVLTQGYADIAAYQTLLKSLTSLIGRFGFEVLDPMVIGDVKQPDDEQALRGAAKAYQLGALATNQV